MASVQIFFENFSTSLTVNCFDEDSEMSIIVRDNGKKATYSLTISEAKQLKKFLSDHIKNETDALKG